MISYPKTIADGELLIQQACAPAPPHVLLLTCHRQSFVNSGLARSPKPVRMPETRVACVAHPAFV